MMDPSQTSSCMAGDGGSVDIGLQAMSGMMYRGHDALFNPARMIEPVLCQYGDSDVTHLSLWREYDLYPSGQDDSRGQNPFSKGSSPACDRRSSGRQVCRDHLCLLSPRLDEQGAESPQS